MKYFIIVLSLIIYLSFNDVSADDNSLSRLEHNHSNIILSSDNIDLSEISGITSSQMNDDFIWAINDGGNGNYIYKIELNNGDVEKFEVRGAKNKDWEAVSSFMVDGESFIVIGDIGDNRAVRDSYNLYFIKEPDAEYGKNFIDVERVINFQYEDGAKDSEALAVDVKGNKIYILSKRKQPPSIYILDLLGNDTVAEKEADLTYLMKTRDEDILSKSHRYGNQPTDLSFSNDGKMAVVITYPYTYFYKTDEDYGWSDALQKPYGYIVTNYLKQGEAISFSRNKEFLLLSSEEEPVPLYKVNIRK